MLALRRGRHPVLHQTFLDANLGGRTLLLRRRFRIFQLCVSQSKTASVMTAAASQHRDGIGGRLHHIYHSTAALSDWWVMVILLHQVCMQRNNEYLRTFVAWIFIMYHSVRSCNDRFCIHVNSQTTLTFPDRWVCIPMTYSRAYIVIRIRFTGGVSSRRCSGHSARLAGRYRSVATSL